MELLARRHLHGEELAERDKSETSENTKASESEPAFHCQMASGKKSSRTLSRLEKSTTLNGRQTRASTVSLPPSSAKRCITHHTHRGAERNDTRLNNSLIRTKKEGAKQVLRGVTGAGQRPHPHFRGFGG